MNFALADEEKALAEALTQILSRVCSTQRIRAWEAEQVSFDDDFLAAIAKGGFLEAGLAFGDCPSFAVLAQLEEVAGRFLTPPLLSWQSAYAAFLLDSHPLAKRIAAGEIVAPAIPGRVQLTRSGNSLSGEASGVLFLDHAQHLLVPLPTQWERLGEGTRPPAVALASIRRQAPSPQPSPAAAGEGEIPATIGEGMQVAETKAEWDSSAGSPDGDLLQTILQKWPAVLQAVRTESKNVEALLRSCAATAVDGATVTLACDGEFHTRELQK
ncbi:MAG: hypothetical protein ACHQ7M_18730, partial [Chloroflexota bacterium]